MAPNKKVTDIPLKTVKKRVYKKKLVKPPLKTPTLLRIQIPNSGSKAPKIDRRVTCQRNVELANEVALAQLTNSLSMSPQPLQLTPTHKTPVNLPANKPKTPRKTKSTPKEVSDVESCSDSSIIAKFAMNYKLLRKSPSTTPKRIRKVTQKASETDSPIKTTRKRKLFENVTSEDGSEQESLQEVVKKRSGPKSKNIINPSISLETDSPFKTPGKRKSVKNVTSEDGSEPENLEKLVIKRCGPKSNYIIYPNKPPETIYNKAIKKFFKNVTSEDGSKPENLEKLVKKRSGPKTKNNINPNKPPETVSSLHNPTKIKIVKNVTSEDGSETKHLQEPLKKRAGPKSKTINPNTPLTKKKPITKPLPETPESTLVVVAKAKNSKERKQTQKKLPDFISDGVANSETPEPEEILPVTPAKRVYKRKRPPKKTETEKKEQMDVPEETAAKRPRGRPKFVDERADKKSTIKTTGTRPNNKGKGLNAQQIKTDASMLESSLVNSNVLTRSNSVNSTNSNLSWTRDISTASSLASGTTFVTVSSKDFVHFDNKIPFVHVETLDKLKVIDEKVVHENAMVENRERPLPETESSSSDSDSSSSDSSDSSDPKSQVPEHELNLSTSSVTKSPLAESKPDNTELIGLEAYKLSNSLKYYYSEIRKSFVSDVDDSCTFSKDLEILVNSCENFKSILDAVRFPSSPEETKNSPVRNAQMEHGKPCRNYTDEFVKPASIGLSVARARDSPAKSHFNINMPTIPDSLNLLEKESAPETDGETNVSLTSDNNNYDNLNYLSFDKTYDDEDALSLYAESMTGMESSRRGSVASISNVSVQDVYVPKTISRTMIEKYNYKPTRIEDTLPRTEDDDMEGRIEPMVKINEPVNKQIKKQNADSTSIIKDTDINKTANDLLEDANKLSSLADNTVKRLDIPDVARKPRRLFASYQPFNCVKSSFYRGHCFFYLASQCKNISCRFPHTEISTELLKCRLALMGEDNLIQEYLLTCKFINLRRKFGLLFIQECKRRKSTRILFEMAIDLGLGVVEWDDILKVNALETTLLHLNTISLDACDDLLKFEHNGRMMCDALLLCVANSQNFAQFKGAFIKLANFMWEIKRPVNIEVVGSILERVCILPCDDSLARGMLCLMKNTDATVFEKSMTKSFEVQLTNLESDVYDEYLLAKKAALESQLGQTSEIEDLPQNVQIPHVDREGPRHTSPDTTNLESLKKAQMAQPTTFKCTIDTDAIRGLFKSPSNPAPKHRGHLSSPRVAHWSRGPGFPMRPPLRGRVLRGRGHKACMPSGRKVYTTPTNYRGRHHT